MCYEEIGLCAQNVLLIVGSTSNIIGGGGGIWPFKKKEISF